MRTPVVLTISGHDPTGGAGIQADIEAIIATGCRAASAVTCLTIQDTADVYRVAASDPRLLDGQIRTLLADVHVAACKIGLIPDMACLLVISGVLRENPGIPVVLDPVLASGAGTELAGNRLIAGFMEHLMPWVTLITPNSIEARRLSGAHRLDNCGMELLAQGCQAVLITGTHESDQCVINRLYQKDAAVIESSWPRLQASFHGSGCTLAASAAAYIARGFSLAAAVDKALEYTWASLSHGDQLGKGQLLPDRLFTWRRHNESD
ncbi:MAG: hydroxymethylpyrimidine/phosphomethylpyrimidine kinase [Gammaproteobacteria bacterium]|nr:hydroxymethylpyrimidine/phosphomethylpyrimidine kinase [Gammaproteobacteria bacterium]